MRKNPLLKRQWRRPLPRFIVAVVVALGILFTTYSSAQQSSNTAPQQGRQVTLREQLTVGLKARTKADTAFINVVVRAVEQGRLPRRLVDTTFLWARERAVKRSYQRRLRPMVYFQPGLTQRARRIGVKL